MKTSDLFSLDWKDAAKGILIAALTGGIDALYHALATPESLSASNLKKAGIAALAGGLGYMIKNFFTSPTLKTPAP